MAKRTFWDMFAKVVRQTGLSNTFNDSTEETESIKEDINDIQKQVLSISKTYLQKAWIAIAWWTVAAQNNYTIPTTVDKVSFVQITSWWVEYFPTEISVSEFNTFANTSSSSDIPSYWTIDKTKLYIYPTPTSSSLPITLNANQFATDLVTDPAVTTDQTTDLEIKEWYENVIYYYALNEAYNRLEDFASADRYLNKFEKLEDTYKKEVRSATNSIIVWSGRRRPTNPNDNPTLT